MGKRFVIIGGGIAGLTAANEIRKNSGEAEIILISNENRLPYYRLSLTRYLAGEIRKDNLVIHPQDWYVNNRIRLIFKTEVTWIDKEKKVVTLDEGGCFEYDKLVMATGARPFLLPVSGISLNNVLTVRTMEDAEYILKKLPEIDSCVCIGGGILGLETAGAIAKSGVRVTLLEAAEWIMARQLNRKASELLKKYMLALGVEVRENVKIKEIYGGPDCEGVRLETGEVFPSRLVVVTAGVRPNTGLAAKAGLVMDKGLLVNDRMQTSDENIYAAGDVTEFAGAVCGLWNIAQNQGRVAALNALGMDTVFENIPPAMMLKVLGLDIFSVGEIIPRDGNSIQYEKEDGESYCCFVLRDDCLVGSILIGEKGLPVKVRKAVEKGVSFPGEIYRDFESIRKKLSES